MSKLNNRLFPENTLVLTDRVLADIGCLRGDELARV
jgi:hypothetical protein